MVSILVQKVWQASIKLLVEAWSGVELETTDIYGTSLGCFLYDNDARLYLIQTNKQI
jgi:hypothetical protein